jgi:hypothetical protein
VSGDWSILEARDLRWKVMQLITILGLAVCLGVIFLRAKAAKGQAPSDTKKRLKTAKILFVALLAWLVISFRLQHLNNALSGEPVGAPSTWEHVITFLSGKD